jgi:hypothetical protein
MERKGKTTTPATNASHGVAPQALHHFALARVRELNLLAERTSSPLKARVVHLPYFLLRLFSWRTH